MHPSDKYVSEKQAFPGRPGKGNWVPGKALTARNGIRSFLVPFTMKTFSAKAEEIDRQWLVIDADGQIVGKVAEKAARILRGKDKPIFTSHVDCGDHVIIINARKARFSGRKESDKVYTSYSGYVGGHKSESPEKLRQRRPELILERAVKGMIPHNRLGSAVLKKLHVYAEGAHPHEAQNPKPVQL